MVKKLKKMKNTLAINEKLLYNIFRCVDGLSPNGKATDSDSVIFLVRIQVAQLYGPGIFHLGEGFRVFFVCNGLFA